MRLQQSMNKARIIKQVQSYPPHAIPFSSRIESSEIWSNQAHIMILWKPRYTVSSPNLSSQAIFLKLYARFPCVTWTPLCSLVDPLVNCKKARPVACAWNGYVFLGSQASLSPWRTGRMVSVTIHMMSSGHLVWDCPLKIFTKSLRT